MSPIVTRASALAQLAAAGETAPELVLQQGAVIDARVLAVRANLVRIAIQGFAIDVQTEVALQVGANLKLMVSQTADGTVRLAVVSPNVTPQGQPAHAQPLAGTTPQVTATPQLSVPPVAPPQAPQVLALQHAIQVSAPRQASLSPLFANLPVIVAAEGVPVQVKGVASQLLSARPQLDTALTALDLRQAFQKSGLLLEARVAKGALPAGTPDLKAALIVFKQVLSNWLGPTNPTAQFSPHAGLGSQGGAPAAQVASPLAATPTPAAVSNLLEAAPVSAQVVPPLAAKAQDGTTQPAAVAAGTAGRERPPATGETTTVRVLAQANLGVGPPVRTIEPGRAGMQAAHLGVSAPPDPPPPPFRGALPSPQAIAQPTLDPDTAPASIGHQLLDQTDAALARQTLLQIASLPDRPDLGTTAQNPQARWSFEIPFATPHGTAVAQFEVARDGGGNAEEGAPSKVWRARFTLDVEPAGPVHALVSLIGERTAVRLWAERAETAVQLRHSADALGQALRQAELEPGDIMVADGAPPRPKLLAGRILDRAT